MVTTDCVGLCLTLVKLRGQVTDGTQHGGTTDGKMEKTRPMRNEMDEKVFISSQSRHFSSKKYEKSSFPFCTLNWHVNNSVSRQEIGLKRRNESTSF